MDHCLSIDVMRCPQRTMTYWCGLNASDTLRSPEMESIYRKNSGRQILTLVRSFEEISQMKCKFGFSLSVFETTRIVVKATHTIGKTVLSGLL